MPFPTRIVILSLVMGVLASSSVLASSFFRPVPDSGANLPADKLYPQGRIFPFGGFSGRPERDVGNGFTFHGPVYNQREDFLETAKQHGVPAIYSIGIDMNFHSRGDQPPLELSAREIRRQITEQVKAVAHEEAIAWWYLTPEEIRHWRPAELEYFQVAVKAIRAADPQKRPIWMYEPGHRTAAALAHLSGDLDIVGKGMYTNYSGQIHTRSWARWTIEAQIESIRMSRSRAFPIAVPEMFVEPPAEETRNIRDWVRHDTYLSLSSGAKGVVIFSLFPRRNFPSFQDYYDAYSEVGKEITGKNNLGDFFLFGEHKRDVSIEITAGEEMVAPKVGSGGVTEDNHMPYTSITVGNIALGDKRLILFINSSREPVSGIVRGIPDNARAQDLFRNFKSKRVLNGFSIEMKPYEVMGVIFSPR